MCNLKVYVNMKIRFLLYSVVGFLSVGMSALAQSPVEKVIMEFEGVDGARDFIVREALGF